MLYLPVSAYQLAEVLNVAKFKRAKLLTQLGPDKPMPTFRRIDVAF
jgi:hypothetical protein